MAGELLTAFVVLKPNKTIITGKLVQWTNKSIKTHYKHLRGVIVFIDQIPKSSSEKVPLLLLSHIIYLTPF